VQDEDLARRVAELLDGRSIATAESCTAGRIAEVLACVPEATDWLRGGVVAYQDGIKRALLDVRAESVLSEQAAVEMAESARTLFGADVTVATTGVAGGEEVEGTPPGTVYIATSVEGHIDVAVHRFVGSPEEVCDQARRRALLDLVAALTLTS
jgi:nicotinamide-nucleotide amidase